MDSSKRSGRGDGGLFFENSLFLPFRLDILHVWVGKEMSLISSPDLITDLCEGSRDIAIREGEAWTNIVLRRYGDLAREFGNDRGHVVLYAAEQGGDLFQQENRHYIRVSFATEGKTLSFGIVEDPFEL